MQALRSGRKQAYELVGTLPRTSNMRASYNLAFTRQRAQSARRVSPPPTQVSEALALLAADMAQTMPSSDNAFAQM